MFDTNALNFIVDRRIDLSLLASRDDLYVTYVQERELKATRNSDRLAALLMAFNIADYEKKLTSTMIWGEAPWEESLWGQGPYYTDILDALNQLNNSKPNNKSDALIGEAAIVNGHTLVTDDVHLRQVIDGKFGVRTTDFNGFLAAVKEAKSAR